MLDSALFSACQPHPQHSAASIRTHSSHPSAQHHGLLDWKCAPTAEQMIAALDGGQRALQED
ncbi:hypothetical protein U9M48_040499 [Paspalum notatum var. saurae]|uniref:Uncharacterized protein n=1 Tax=Paspalum notatum var. saurae TaxID=547442 RepID=A0AAQ3XDU1_PASNO